MTPKYNRFTELSSDPIIPTARFDHIRNSPVKSAKATAFRYAIFSDFLVIKKYKSPVPNKRAPQ